MLEVQIKNEEAYQKLKPDSIYHSDLTHVCSFPDQMLNDLKRYGVLNKNVENEEKPKPKIRIKGKTMSIDNAPLDMLLFLGNRLPNDSEIAVSQIERVRQLIYSGVLDVDQSFLDFYSHMDKNSPVSNLLYGNKRYRRQMSLEDMIKNEHPELEEVTIGDSLLSNPKKIRTKEYSYKNLKVKFTSDLEKNNNGAGYNIKARDEKGRQIYLTKYYRPNDIEKLLLRRGQIVNIAYGSERNRNMSIFIGSFDVIPEGFKLKLETKYYARTRSISTDYFNVLFGEYRLRNELTTTNALNLRANMRGQYAKEGVFE